MSVDVVPCIDSEPTWGYTPLLRPKENKHGRLGVDFDAGLELSSSEKDWNFLKYVPMEVLCGYTLTKLLRSQASTFKAEDEQVYKAEDILPSYMLKTAIMWILDPVDQFHSVYTGLNSIFPHEPGSAYCTDVLQLSSELLQQMFEDLDLRHVMSS